MWKLNKTDKNIIRQIILFVCFCVMLVGNASGHQFIIGKYFGDFDRFYITLDNTDGLSDFSGGYSNFGKYPVNSYTSSALSPGNYSARIYYPDTLDTNYPVQDNIYLTTDPTIVTYNLSDGFNIEIGDTVTWDKSEYIKGETAQITISFNSSNFDTTAYNYQYDIVDPDGEYVRFQELQYSANHTINIVLTKPGVYEGSVYISNKNDINDGIYLSSYDYIIVTDDTTQSFISFDKSSYTLGDTGIISYGLSSSFWDFAQSRYIEIHKDGSLIDEIDNIQNFGTYYYKFSSPGYYTAKYYTWSITDGQVLRSTSLVSNVQYGQSYIYVNETVSAGFVNNFSYLWGFTPTYTGYKWAYLKYYNDDLNIWELENTISLSGTVKNTLYTTSILFKKEGTYLIEICDLNKECPAASKTTNAIFKPQDPIHNYSTNAITILNSKSSYAQGDTMQFRFQIAGVDFSNKFIDVEIYNNGTGINYTLLRAQTDFEEHNYYLGQLYGNGSSLLRITGTNDSGRFVLASTSIIMSIIDTEGYGLELSDSNICLGDIVNVLAITPGNATIRFTDDSIITYNFTGTRTFQVKPISDMTISLEDNYGLQRKSGLINIDSACENIIVEPDTNDGESGTQSGRQMDGLVLLLGQGLTTESKLIFAVLVMAIVLVGIYWSTKSQFIAVIGAGSWFIWMTIIEYIPIWVIIVIVIAMLIKGKFGGE